MNFTVIGPIYPYRGGISHFTTQLIQALSKTGHTVQPISFKRQYPSWLYPGKSDKDPSKNPIQLEAQYLLDPLNPFTWTSTVDQIYSRKPDLVIIQWWTTFWALAFACICMLLKRKKVKVGYIVHNVLPHEQRFFDPWLAKLALSQGQYFLTQTEEEKHRLLKLIPGRNVNVCYLPTYSIISDRQLSREEARQIMGFPSNRPLILFFGIVRPYKGLKNLIESIAILNAKHPDVRPYLLVAGEIWDDKKVYEELITRLDITECVRLDDRYIPDEEVAVILSASDMLVAPYVDATQSAAVGLAMGFGLPMIVTDVVASGISEENQPYIKIVKVGDVNALANAVWQVISGTDNFHPKYLAAEEAWRRMVVALEGFA